jgi:hypothetical protein
MTTTPPAPAPRRQRPALRVFIIGGLFCIGCSIAASQGSDLFGFGAVAWLGTGIGSVVIDNNLWPLEL